MQEYGFDAGIKSIKLSIGDYVGVAEIELVEGNLLKAADLFTKAGENTRAVEIMVGVAWRDLTIGVFDGGETDSARLVEVRKLVQKVMRLKVDSIAAHHKVSHLSTTTLDFDAHSLTLLDISQFSFLKEIAAAEIDTAKLTEIIQSDSPINHRILSLDAILSSSPPFHKLETPDVEALLSRFEDYHQLLKTTIIADTASPAMQQVFGFRSTSDRIELLSSSPLNTARLISSVDQATPMMPSSIQRAANRYVAIRIFGQLQKIEAIVNRKELRPLCAELIFIGVCKTRMTSCRQQHCSIAGLEDASRTTTRLLGRLVSIFSGVGRLALTRDERDFVEKNKR